MCASSKFNDIEATADAIGQASPFSVWPRAALIRLAAVSTVSNHPAQTGLVIAGECCDSIIVVVDGMVASSVSSPEGRRVIFKFDDSHCVCGLKSLVDGLPSPHDLVAAGPVGVIRVPHAAIRAELSRMPALWESIAVEATRRGRYFNTQMQRFVFDAPLVRAATLLLSLLAKDGKDGVNGTAAIDLRLPQERLAELLGTSRQWATALVREMTNAGLIEWRYGRVKLLDVPALRALAARSIDVTGHRDVHPAPQRRVDPTPVPRAGAATSAIGHADRRNV